jgi:hypothetical protein
MKGDSAVTRLEWMAVRLVEVHRDFPEWADRVGLLGLSCYLADCNPGDPAGSAEGIPAAAATGVPLLSRWRAWRVRRRAL